MTNGWLAGPEVWGGLDVQGGDGGLTLGSVDLDFVVPRGAPI